MTSLLSKKKEKIRIGLIGAGYAAKGFAMQCVNSPDIALISVANRTPERAKRMLVDVGADLSNTLISDDYENITTSRRIDIVVEATGDVEFGAAVTLSSIENQKHIILINAELDATLGPILKKGADTAGIIYSQADGDQPAVILNLIDEVKLLGLKPIVAGNIKTYFNRYATPDTQREWANQNNLSPTLATNAVDGTKLAIEMATVANATGFKTDIRAMHGFKLSHVDDAISAFSKLSLTNKHPIIDYILGAKPSFGIFVIAQTDNLLMQEYLGQFKMGDGPYYLFYRPFHLCTLEAHKSIYKIVYNKKATLAPTSLSCEVIAIAKRDLLPGQVLDGIGGFCSYGVVENSSIVKKDNLLPIGLSRGCKVLKKISKDSPIDYNDISLPKDRLVDKLYNEQISLFGV